MIYKLISALVVAATFAGLSSAAMLGDYYTPLPTVNTGGCVIVTLVEAIQPNTSVTETV